MPAPGKQSRGGRRGRLSRGGPRWLFHPVRYPSYTSARSLFPCNGAPPPPHCPPPPPPPANMHQSPPPVASSRLDDSTCQPAPPTPPCRTPLPPFYFHHFERQHLSRPLLCAPRGVRGKKMIPLPLFISLGADAAVTVTVDAIAAEQPPRSALCLIPCPASVGYSGPERAPLRGTVITRYRGTDHRRQNETRAR